MGFLIRAGWEALKRRVAPRPSITAVHEALRGQAGIGSVEAVDVSAAERGGALVKVDLRIADGADAHEVASRAGDRLHERLPGAEVRVYVSGGDTK
jgi:hypothetical protein